MPKVNSGVLKRSAGGTEREFRRQWQLTFEMTSLGIALIDPATGRIHRVNAAFAAMHGGVPGDFAGLPIGMALSEQWRSRAEELARVVHRHGTLRFECDRPRLDGSTFPAEVEVLAVRDDDARAAYRVVYVRDLTELRAREASERLAVNRFERIFEDAPIGMMVVRSGGIERANAAAAAVFGRAAADLVGCDPRTLVHPEEVGLTDVARSELMQGGAPPAQSRRIVRPDGSVRHTWLTFTTVDGDGTAEPAALVLITDRTAEVEADRAREAALRLFSTAVGQAPIGMCLVGVDGSLLQVNAALCRLVGRTEADLLATHVQDLIHPYDLETDLALMRECLDGTRDGYEIPVRYLTAEGDVVHVLLSVGLVRGTDGEPQHFVAQVVDLTQLHTAEQQLRLVEERDRIAGALHDTSIQRLFAVGLMLQRVAGDLQDPAQVRRLENAIKEIDTTISGIRTVIYGLRPAAAKLD